MTEEDKSGGPQRVRWDGRRILFEVRHDGKDVPCALSADVLRELAAQRVLRPNDVLDCFTATRPRVEAIVLNKLRARGVPMSALLTIWSDDVADYGADPDAGT